MTWIKICGTTNLEDAQTAVEAGADALGFVFYEKSPRNIDPAKAREIVAALPVKVEKVGVFVTQSSEEIAELADQTGLTAAQLYTVQNNYGLSELYRLKQLCPTLKLTLAFPMSVARGDALLTLDDPEKRVLFAVMFDSGTGFKPGGTGKKFNWQRAKGMVQHISTMVPVVVAGGLNPQNVGQAIKLFHPFGVDVVSGVEASPGKKDPDKVRAFVRAVRAADSGA
jgi:phosphoribosylanthranilate isomerase